MNTMYQIYDGKTLEPVTVIYNCDMRAAAAEYFRANPWEGRCYVATDYRGRMTRYEHINHSVVPTASF